jgi:DNA-binding protein YbaB
LDALRRAIEEYPTRVRELSRQAAEAAQQTVIGDSGSGQVVVTLTGAGEIRSVRVSHGALRQLDNRTLGERVKAAVNAGLERAEAILGAAHEDPGDAEEQALARYEQRMDELLFRMDSIGRGLDRLDD